MLKRCIVVKPAGRSFGESARDRSIGWYDVSYRQLIDHYFNTGDSAVYDSTLRIVKFDEYSFVNIDDPVDAATVSSLEHYDCFLLRASNYIHPEMDWTNFLPWLEALELPVICCGIGAQAAKREKFGLPDEHVRIWKIISERTPAIGVRGAYTAEILNDIGVKNVEIVGCPTLFRDRNPALKLKAHEAPDPGSTVSFSIRRETGEGYTTDATSFLNTQKGLIERFAGEFDLFLTAHGEVEEKIFYYRDPTRLKAATEELRRTGWFDGPGSLIETLYHQKLFFAPVVAYMDEFNRSMAATLGYRVHGVLPALAVGTPGVLLSYDARSGELAETLSIPLMDPASAAAAPTDEIFDPARFAEFERRFPFNYSKMKNFIESNGAGTQM